MANISQGEPQGPVDIIVVGAGGCGLVAALAAAQRGARVLVLEKTEEPGGTTALAAGSVVGAGTSYQRREEIEDDSFALVQDILTRNGQQGDRELTEALAASSAAVVDWLGNTLGPPAEIRTRTSGHGVRRFHTWGTGQGLVNHLVAAVEGEAKIDVLYSTPVVSLRIDPGGAVTGVETEGGAISARKVILATGGFGASADLLLRHIPKAAGIPYGGHRGSTGDGLRLGDEAGAATAQMDAFQPYPSYIVPQHLEVPGVAIFHGSIHVDQMGRRFGNETLFPGGIGARMLDLPAGQAYQVFDRRIYDLLVVCLPNGFTIRQRSTWPPGLPPLPMGED